MNFVLHALFEDRVDAGQRLAVSLLHYADDSAVVLGLARGGVTIAAEVAKRLRADLDVLVVRKLGSPQSEELAIGAVTANGGYYLNEDVIRYMGVSSQYLENEMRRQRQIARER